MILILASKYRKYVASFMMAIFYSQMLVAQHYAIRELSRSAFDPGYLDNHQKLHNSIFQNPAGQNETFFKKPFPHERKVVNKNIGGPTQPEMDGFKSVNSNNMVDLFTGDFSYNIPLLDVGGYPVNISYHSGISMDEEASWVGLGWNINPGTITRNMRGIPDDFSGGADTVRKVSSVKPNNTFGVTVSATFELQGLPIDIGPGLGIFHNTYNGWGMEASVNASLNAGQKSHGPLSGGLSITNNSQNGVTLNPSLSAKGNLYAAANNGAGFGLQLSAPYNSRTGLKDISLGLNVRASNMKDKAASAGLSGISFAWTTYTPTITMPYTNFNYSFTGKLGGALYVGHPNLYINGYVSSEYIAAADTSLSLPAYGYLNFQERGTNWSTLTDFNREKEMPYRESPPVPHIAVPSYTYDAFSISGEGTGGMFRPYRGDMGFIADHLNKSKTISAGASVDFGAGNLIHGGVDLYANYAVTQTGPWLPENPLGNTISFHQNNGLFEAAYFRNPAEKTSNSTAFYNAMGGDDVVAADLYQSSNSSPSILATNILSRFSNKSQIGKDTLTSTNVIKNSRDKRSQVISYLTASEASVVGLSKYIEHYAVNQFSDHYCQNNAPEDASGNGTGIMGEYFTNRYLNGTPKYTRLDPFIYFNWDKGNPFWNTKSGTSTNQIDQSFPSDNFSARWTGRLKAPASGTYSFGTYTDDGLRFWVNDSLVIDDWAIHGFTWDTCRLNLVEGTLYDIKIEYFENGGYAFEQWAWKRPDEPTHPFDQDHKDTIPTKYLYPPVFSDTAVVNPVLTREDRVNNFRKANHISEIDVLNPDGRRYVYGIPVYNFIQKEVSFSVNKSNGNSTTSLASYVEGQDNSTKNTNGKDGYFSKEEIPAYAHSFLLTGVLSSDYVDVTGDGISDDDLGDAVQFKYSKTSGIANPYGWRVPYITDSANYNEGFKTYDRDDKANYIYGNKELWYLHTIESKTMVATFTLQHRSDERASDERGIKGDSSKAMCLKEINLYTKADFLKNGTSAIPIKTVHFEYDYELCRGINQPVNDSGKLTLKRIWFTYNGNDKGILNPYEFHYNNINPAYKVNSTDKWGTYKDAALNPSAANNADYPYAIQDSVIAAQNASAWTMDSIKLPSGGRIKVNYESDDYAFVQNRRATQMMKIAGFGHDTLGTYNGQLYNSSKDQLYIYATVPTAISNNSDIYARYLTGISKFYFRLFVKMPTDDFGSGSEYIPGYAEPDTSTNHWYGKSDSHTIWIKIKGVDQTGSSDGPYNPLAQTAINFLRLNLPSKAYPGTEVNENLNLADAIKIIGSMSGNIVELLNGFNETARKSGWVSQIDTSHSFIRLNCPTFKKYGGGVRVQSILIYDNWNEMTHKKETVYGQKYIYTTAQDVNGNLTTISSGVASWEPSIGGDENPFHLPIEYVDRVSLLAPAATLYSEEPLGESFYPAPSIGYSKVRVRSIHTDKTRSANGYAETTFYTSYDFPTSWDWSMLDNNTKKRYKPLLGNFLRINARNYLTLSQGFKVELNDMNGKLRTEASYAETDSANLISYTENFYHVDNGLVSSQHLNNSVPVIDASGNIDTAGTIGKDIEVMSDMRDQTSTSIGGNVNLNVDLFTAGVWPVLIPSLLNLYQKETNQYRSVAMTKIIQRYGILDSVVHIDKGSKIYTKNILYDEETGEPILSRTQNEFNDSLYQFSYPAHWIYRGVGQAYQNIDAYLMHLKIAHGKIISGLTLPDSAYLTAGDELLVYSKENIASICLDSFATFPNDYKLWVIDTNVLRQGAQQLFLVDNNGTPFSGNDVSLKVIRSGRRNLGASVGSVVSLGDPMRSDSSHVYHIVFDSLTRVINSTAKELTQYWEVADKRRSNVTTSCIGTSADSTNASNGACGCLKPLLDYLIASKQLFIPKAAERTVGSLVNAAITAGYLIDTSSCPILTANSGENFYSLSADSISPIYVAQLGHEIIDLRSISGLPMNVYQLVNSSCVGTGKVIFKNPGMTVPAADTVTQIFYPQFTANLLSTRDCPIYLDSLLTVDSTSDKLLVENNLNVSGGSRNAVSILRFDQLGVIPGGSTLLSASMMLRADIRGHIPGILDSANSTNPEDSTGYGLTSPAGWFPYLSLDTTINQSYYGNWFQAVKNGTPFQNDTLNVLSYLNGFLSGTYASSTFVLTQGSGVLYQSPPDTTIGSRKTPAYLLNGYSNYYSTFYSTHYSDTTKWPVLRVQYILPQTLTDTAGFALEYNSTINCTSVVGRSCYSSITDTLVNPYVYGILGNFRENKNYVYYGSRTQQDPLQATHIRTDGTISGYAPFWTLQSGIWQPSYDTTRWVWNSQPTLFNRKGFNLEEVNPLGIYKAGLYGYGLTMPTASIQNSRFQESAFEGFEDYNFSINSCDTGCLESRAFDFSNFSDHISDSLAHTGLYSLRVGRDSSIGITVSVKAIGSGVQPALTDSIGSDECNASLFGGIRATTGNILPSMTLLPGKKMLISAWVKERNSCSCGQYTRNSIILNFYGGTSVTLTFKPSGNIIEGWERYEASFTVPADATSMQCVLQASDSSTTYFDDLRIHPYNAEMKSYVYNPINLRMMAELDENNYASFYEYDDDGTLVRVKKETHRGIQTIKETRSALLKNQ